MRVYALYCRNKWVLWFVVLEVAAGAVVACWAIIKMVFSGTIYRYTPERSHLLAVAFSGLLVVDFTVFILTMGRSIKLWTRKEPFLHRLFVDGFLYYGIIWNFNLVNVLVLLFVNPNIDLSIPIHTNILSVVLVSRLMINLRDPTLRKSTGYEETDATTHAGCVSTLVTEGAVWTMPPDSSESR